MVDNSSIVFLPIAVVATLLTSSGIVLGEGTQQEILYLISTLSCSNNIDITSYIIAVEAIVVVEVSSSREAEEP